MVVENIMYFALGLLSAALLALIVMPAVWSRAVRLTTKRIEAATPITLSEFRADKDQLRAEFALSTRRLEMTVEALRRRLAEQLRDINRSRTELGAIDAERETHAQIVAEMEAREAELKNRIIELEKETTDLAQRFRMRDREFAEKVAQLEAARAQLRGNNPHPHHLDGHPLSGDYDADIDELLQRLDAERRRAAFLETQNRTLIDQLEHHGRPSSGIDAETTEVGEPLPPSNDDAAGLSDELIAAEARIADAENRVNALLEQTTSATDADGNAPRHARLLADHLTLEEELDQLRAKVSGVEDIVLTRWDSGTIDHPRLREQLGEIAAEVSRLVYATDDEPPSDPAESLFERVQRFAEDGLRADEFPVRSALQAKQAANLEAQAADRLAAAREIRERR